MDLRSVRVVGYMTAAATSPGAAEAFGHVHIEPVDFGSWGVATAVMALAAMMMFVPIWS
jgi:hypothetical protein